MNLPTREEAHSVLEKHVKDEYQRYHALMVATAMEGYAELFGEDNPSTHSTPAQGGEQGRTTSQRASDLWYITGLLHDLDFEKHPDVHPAKSLDWLKEWSYPEELIHAVEAHAYGYNNFEVLPQTKLASALMACDEISGIFYAYRKMNPISYGEMKTSSINKRLKEKAFAAKIHRDAIYRGCELLGVELNEHINNLIKFFAKLK
ncbi:MAG: HD domain-containing protein [Candidatus Colwellbacteria bacterium]